METYANYYWSAGFLIRSYGTLNGVGRCSVACYDRTWAMLVQSKRQLKSILKGQCAIYEAI